MTKKAKLAFDMLEKEMELITKGDMSEFKGGDGSGDCLFQALSFATGRPVAEIQTAYANYYAQETGQTGWTAETSFNVVGLYGVRSEDVDWLTEQYGMSSGYNSSGDTEHSYSGDAGIIITSGHAFNITGNADSTGYYYHDPQTGTNGTISKTDPKIISIYGFNN